MFYEVSFHRKRETGAITAAKILNGMQFAQANCLICGNAKAVKLVWLVSAAISIGQDAEQR